MSEVSNPHERDFVNPDHSNQVLYQLSELWRDKKLCDATIEVGPVKVYVHRLVLLATCPYLLTIGGQYDVPLLEVKLPMSVGLEGLNIFLTYLYDGVLHLTTTNLVSVEKISKILRVSTIKKFCREFRELNEAIIAKDSGLDKFSTDYSLKVTENSIQIIFAELNTGETTVKREAADSDSEIPDPKRRRVNIQSLSPVLQHTTPTPSFTSICVPQQVSSEQSTKAPSSRSDISDSGNQSVSCDNSVLSIKQEPQDYSEEMFLTTDNESSTDFVKRAAYNTETLHSQDEDSMASSSQSNPPSSSQQSLRYHSPVTYMSENNQQTEDRVDPKQVLKNVMKNFADGSTTDTGSEHQMRSDNGRLEALEIKFKRMEDRMEWIIGECTSLKKTVDTLERKKRPQNLVASTNPIYFPSQKLADVPIQPGSSCVSYSQPPPLYSPRDASSRLETPSYCIQQINSPMILPVSLQSQKSDTITMDSEVSYNGRTEDELRRAIRYEVKLAKAVKIMLQLIFDDDYIASHSVTGTASNSLNPPKPAFDSHCIDVIKKLAREKFGDHVQDAEILEKVRNVIKLTRNKLHKEISIVIE